MRLTIILILISFAFTVHAQKNDKIRWLNSSQLKWDNFKGKAPSKSPMAAETSTHLDFGMSFQNGKFDWKVDCYFTPSESWVKKELKSDDLLVHEQLHFDIAELHARKIRKQMDELDLKSINDQKKLQKTFENGYNKMSQEQAKYDNETNHGLIPETQKQWVEKIQAELQSTQDYATANYTFD